MQSKVTEKGKIKALITNFKDHIVEYKKASYNEASLRIDFLNKFLNALGWDVENKKNLSPSYREVVTEDKIKVEDRTKAPDYSFRSQNGTRQFFLESKRPSINILTHAPSAFQVRRYAWNANVGISILSNFEYLAVYDCTNRPLKSSPASSSRLKIIHFEEYLNEFEYIWENFSKEAVFNGSLKKFKKISNKKGTSSVDNDFLKSLDNWRSALAINIFTNNSVDETQLNYAVQKIINQIIFLRIAEDRDIGPYGMLLSITNSQTCFKDFLQICNKANDKYNSELFNINPLLKSLTVENKSFVSIINELYFPQCPYDFSVLPLDILGKAYEQFLGKVILIDKKHKLSITEKLEVKKAGGVFYTPKYIVETIVRDTLGTMIKNATPKKVKEIKILDPACGSGTFLLAAFEYLLDWYKKYYEKENTKLSKKALNEILTPHGELTTKFKGQILLDNIHGIDVDRNAVEVTKLSLLLKCLEGENKDSLKAQMSLFQERVLPSIDQNIVSGNSLIDFDIYGLSPNLETDLRIKRKINAFNWETHFKDIFKNSNGFHIVIGNPPYVRQELFTDLKPYLKTKYEVFSGTADLYTYFFEKSYQIMAAGGLFSIIVANKWFRANSNEELRKWLKGVCIQSIKDFSDLPVFENATTYPCIVKIKKSSPQKRFLFIDLLRQGIRKPQDHHTAKPITIETTTLDAKGWILTDKGSLRILNSIKKCSLTLGKYLNNNVYRGIVTGLNDAFVISEEMKTKLIKAKKKNAELIRPFVEGKDVKAYSKIIPKNHLIFTRRGINIEEYPSIKNHLENFKKRLMPKPKNWMANDKWSGRKPGKYKWYEIQDSIEYYKEFDKNKIIYPNICKRPEFSYDTNGLYANDKCFIIPTNDLFLLGVLNSDLAHFWFKMYLPKLRGGFYEPNYVIFKNFPIIKINLQDDNAMREKVSIIKNVKKILKLTENDTIDTQKECLYLKNEVNKSVYKLYNIDKSESDHIMEILENAKHK